MKTLFWLALSALFICLGLYQFAKPHFGNGAKEMREEEIRAVIQEEETKYKVRNQELLREFQQKLETAGDVYFNLARVNVNPFVDCVTELPFCFKLCYEFAKDKIHDTQNANDMLNRPIKDMFILQCETGHAEIEAVLQEFLLKLQENDVQFKAGMAELLDEHHFTVKELGLREDFLKKNIELEQKAQEFAMSKMLATVGTVIEVAMIKGTVGCIRTATSALVTRGVTSMSIGGGLALADGPLPVLDIVGAGVAIGGLVWTAYDIYEVTCTLPQEMRTHLMSMINSYQAELHDNALKHARDVLTLCENGCAEITQTSDEPLESKQL